MRAKESSASFIKTTPLAPPPRRNGVDTLGIAASFAVGFIFVCLFLPWMNYTLLAPCSIVACPPPIPGQANILTFIAGIGSQLPTGPGAIPANSLEPFKHAAGLLMLGAWSIIVCVILIAIALFFFVRNIGTDAKAIGMRKRTGRICLVTSIIALLTTSWIAFNIAAMDQVGSVHTTLGIGLWTTAISLGALTTFMVISAVRFRSMS